MKVQSTKGMKVTPAARTPAETPAKAPVDKAPVAGTSADSFTASAALAAAPGDPFASVETFVKAVETTEAGIRNARKTLATAEVTRKRVDADTQKPLTEAQAARDAKDAQAVKPLRAAQAALDAKKKEMQAPIDATQAQLAQANKALEVATYPDKEQVDGARAAAHAEVRRQEGNVKNARTGLDRVESDLNNANQDMQQHRVEQTRDLAELDRVRSRQQAARTDLSYAEAKLPSQYERDNALRRYDEADRAYRSADNELSDARRVVQQRRETLDRLSGADRPTPPGGNSGSDRPTPPGGNSGSDRPTPPGGNSGNNRPTPPGGNSSSGNRPTPPGGSSSSGSVSERPTPPGGSTSSSGGRPTPPGGSSSSGSTGNRPTPPGGSSDRPTPPGGSGGSDRPTPPGGGSSSSSGDVEQARIALSDAERAASRAESRRNDLRPPLDAARAEVDRHKQLAADVQRIDGALRSLDQDAYNLRGRIDGHERSIQSLDTRIIQLKRDRTAASDRLNGANRDLGGAQSEARRLDETPYAKGEPAKIQAAQAKVDQTQKTLDGHQKAYKEQVGAASQKVDKEQATYDGTMAPFRQTVADAEARRSRELGEAERAEGSARADLQGLQGQYEQLHEVPSLKKLKWKSPKWVGGEGFNVDDFWKKRQAP